MKTNELISNSSVPKRAEDYSETELYSLLSANKDQNEGYKSIVMKEMKSQNLLASAEEGMKLLKALSTFTIYDSLGEKQK